MIVLNGEVGEYHTNKVSIDCYITITTCYVTMLQPVTSLCYNLLCHYATTSYVTMYNQYTCDAYAQDTFFKFNLKQLILC